MQRKEFTGTELLENSFIFIKEQLKSIETWLLITAFIFLAIVGLGIFFSLFMLFLLLLVFIFPFVFTIMAIALLMFFLSVVVGIKILKKIISFLNAIMLNSLDVALYRPMRKFEKGDDRLGFFKLWIILSMLTTFGFLFFIIPGIYFAVRASMSYPIYLEERCSPFEAIKKSFEMTQGNFWPLLLATSINYFLIIIPIINIITTLLIPITAWNTASMYAQLKNR